MNTFDQAARYAAQLLDAMGFLRWALPEHVAAWRWAGWLQTQSLPFPGEPERLADTIAVFERLAGDAPPAAVVIEFQSRPQADMLERLAEYVLRLRREKLVQQQPRVAYEVAGVLFNLTGAAQSDTWLMQPANLGGMGLRFQARVRTLRQEDARALLAQVAQGQASRCVLPWAPLLSGGGDEATVTEWKRLAEQEGDMRRRASYAGLALVFADLAGCAEVWERGLEGWNVEESQIVLKWQAKARAEGEARGRAETRIEVLRTNLLEVIRAHCNTEPPEFLVAAVQAQNDPEILDRWFKQALRAGSLQEVQAALGLAGSSPGEQDAAQG